MPPLLLFCLLLSALLRGQQQVAFGARLLDDFEFRGGPSPDDHYRLGVAMGTAYRDAIQKRMNSHKPMVEAMLATSCGKQAYIELLATHEELVPTLVLELKGMANASRVPFDLMFGMSLQEELGFASKVGQSSRPRPMVDHCSDYMMCTKEHCFDAHNEDGDQVDEQMFVGKVNLGGGMFTFVNYVGDLCGGMSALAFNGYGLAFSLNYVSPGRCDTNALGRNYVSRMLLGARTWDEATSIISKHHAMGHNYQLIDFVNRRISNFEVANDVVVERPIVAPFFHANQYQTLQVPDQIISNSSMHRLARVRELPMPQNALEALQILGDQHDRAYPIFHDQLSHSRGELSDWTLATALFDVDHRTVQLFDGNPKEGRVQRSFFVPVAGAAFVV